MKTLVHLFAVAAIAFGASATLFAGMPNIILPDPILGFDYTVSPRPECKFSGANAQAPHSSASLVPYYTEYFVVNRTRKPIQVGLSQSARGLQNAADVHDVARRDTLRGGEFVDEDEFGGYAQRIHFQLNARKPKWMQGVAIDMEHPAIVQVDATHRRCYFFITKTQKPYY